MQKKPSLVSWPMYVAVFGFVGVLGLLIWGASRSTDEPSQQAANEQIHMPEEPAEPEEPPVVMPSGFAMVGGVQRPASDVKIDSQSSASARRSLPKKRQGFSPALSPDENEQVQAVFTALKDENRSQPERFSSFVVPRNFDADAFKENPTEYAQQYASIVEPGRVFAPAQPGEDVPVIRSGTRRFHRVKQGESVRLSVKAAPNAPVTFTSQDLGQFANKLSSMTVVAGEDGTATANYTATGGTIDEVQILAASPITSGQVAFTVSVNVDG